MLDLTVCLLLPQAPARLGAPKIALRHAVAARRCQRLVTMAVRYPAGGLKVTFVDAHACSILAT